MQHDTDLIVLLKEGDKRAFELIYDRYADILYRYVYGRVGIREDSEEIVQEIFVWLWSRRETLNVSSPLSAYLYGASKNRIFNYMRSGVIRKKYAIDFTLYLAGRADNTVEEFMNVSDLHATIEQSISQLPDKCQTAFRLSRLEHHSISNIAERMNISPRTVENYLSQALKHLRLTLLPGKKVDNKAIDS